jgi:RNA polymerase sigma-70 factor (ECF subfamily)
MDDDATGPDGRAAWIAAAVERYEAPLSRYASRFLGDPDHARDVVQDTFLRLCRQDRAALNGRLGEWLYTVCRNRAVDVRRKERRVRPLEGHEPPSSPVADEGLGSSAPAGSSPEVIRALSRLSANQQEVIRLKFQHGLRYKEIAAVTGLSVSNVGFLIHTGIKKMRATLGGSP